MKKSDLESLRVAQPCPQSWAEMKGNDQKRFCAQCNLHVHNLSAMSPCQIRKLALSPGRRCVAYLQNDDGSIRTRSRFESLRRPFARGCRLVASVLALIFPFSFISCAEKERPPIETIETRTVPNQDIPVPGQALIRGEVAPGPVKPVPTPPMTMGTPIAPPPPSK